MSGGPRIRWYEIVIVAVFLVLVAATVYQVRRERVGLVDLDEVAGQLGKRQMISQEYLEWHKAAVTRVDALEKEFQARSRELDAKLMQSTDESEKARVKQELEEIGNNMRASARQTYLDLQKHRDELVVEFRKQVHPIVTAVARRRRLDIVLELGSGGVVYGNKRVDITEEVVKQARAAGLDKVGETAAVTPVTNTVPK